MMFTWIIDIQLQLGIKSLSLAPKTAFLVHCSYYSHEIHVAKKPRVDQMVKLLICLQLIG